MLLQTAPCKLAPPELLEYFKNITLVLELGGSADFSVSTDAICRWVKATDEAFKAAAGIVEARNLQLLYRRSLRFGCPGLLQREDAVQRISRTAAETGYAFSVTLSVSEVLRDRAVLESLFGSFPGGVALVIDNDSLTAPVEDCRSLIEGILQHTALTLIGSIDVVDRWGALDSSRCNASGMNLVPAPTTQAADLGRVKRGWFAPCHVRTGLFVDAKGDIYPCRALLGMTDYRIGSIHDPIDTGVLSEFMVGGRSLRELVLKGPFADGIDDSVVALGQANMCDAHVHALRLRRGAGTTHGRPTDPGPVH